MQDEIYDRQEKIERMDREIGRKSYEISRMSAEESVEVPSREESSFAQKFICFFLM